MAPAERASGLRSLVRRPRRAETPQPRAATPAIRPEGRAVYVVGGTWLHGGTKIALRVGELLEERFGFALRLVQGRSEKGDELVSVDEVRRYATPEDVIVCNPSFSDHQLGLTSQARVLMYIQSVNAYRAIDGFCDLYVSSSTFVRDHLALHYGMDTEIISPFIDIDTMPVPLPFDERISDTAIVYSKLYGETLLPALEARLAARSVPLALTRPGSLPHAEYLTRLGQHRFCVCLPPFEGFGLVPLESLALGTVPLGFHGNGALDYLDAVTGRGMTRYPELDDAAQRIEALVADPAAAEEVSAAGPEIAARYRREVFDERWTGELARFLAAARPD